MPYLVGCLVRVEEAGGLMRPQSKPTSSDSLHDGPTSASCFPDLELVFCISVVNSDTAEKGTFTE